MADNKELKINHVKKVFKIKGKSIEVLTDINIDIKEGEFISIVGSSGCGKSTLLRMIAGLETPTSGGIKKVIDVKLSRPRGRNSYDFMSIRKEIYKEFFEDTDIELEYYL